MNIEQKALLIVSRVNPALPVYCRGARNLASRLAAAAWVASLSPRQLALAVLDLRQRVPFTPQDPARIIIGAHYRWALSRALRRPGLIDLYASESSEATATALLWARMLPIAFPRLAEAAQRAGSMIACPAWSMTTQGHEKIYRLCQEAIEAGEAEDISPPAAAATLELDGTPVELGLME